MITYSDPSAIMGVLLADAPDHDQLRRLIVDGAEPVFTSEIAITEVASASMAAEHGSRVSDGRLLISGFETLCANGSRIRMLTLRPARIFARACEVMTAHHVYALDAIHLAVALEDVVPLAAGEPVRFLTRDRVQADVARALGFTVA